MTSFQSRPSIIVLVAILALFAQVAAAAAAVASGQCSSATAEKMQKCLDRLESDEAKLPGGPCSSSDWSCICTKQQGFIDCYAPCPDQMSEDTDNFNKNNCAGQHNGITIAGLGGNLKYTWSNLNDILQGATVSTGSSSGEGASDAPNPSTTSSTAATSSSTTPSKPTASTGAMSNSNKTTSSHVTGATYNGTSSAAAPAVAFGCVHVALVTIALSFVIALATTTTLL